MRRVYLTCAALLAGASACSDATLPTATTDAYTPSFGISDPPPPPVTGIVTGRLSVTSSSAASALSLTAENSTQLRFRVTYTENPSGTEAQIRNWISLTSNTVRIGTPKITEHDGSISGQGAYKVFTDAGPGILDLSTVQGTILDPLRVGTVHFSVLATNQRSGQSRRVELELNYPAPKNEER